jgi:NTE family protein
VVKCVDLVLSGGGVKGLATPGAVRRLLEDGYTFPRVAGTSAGAITAAIVAAIHKSGGNSQTLRDVMSRLDPSRIPDRTTGIPVLGEVLSFIASDGFYEGDYIRNWVYQELRALNVRTFADLRRDDPDDDSTLTHEQRYSLVVMATDVTHGRSLRLPWDYFRTFHRDPDELLVADAVRMSLSIPFYFDPCTLSDATTGEQATIVDGGILSNLPIDIFDRTDGARPRWTTFGVRLLPDLPEGLGTLLPIQIPDLLRPSQIRLLEKVIATSIVGHDQTHLEQPGVAERVIEINTSGVHLLEFDLSVWRREVLDSRGWQAADDFLRKHGHNGSAGGGGH